MPTTPSTKNQIRKAMLQVMNDTRAKPETRVEAAQTIVGLYFPDQAHKRLVVHSYERGVSPPPGPKPGVRARSQREKAQDAQSVIAALVSGESDQAPTTETP